MIGFSLNPSPPMADLTVAGKFGGILQVVLDDLRSMNSQVSLKYPSQISSLERPC
jgi:hypothetical protein